MTIAVNDANIFIDLVEINLIDTFFDLKLDLHTTNLVLNELDHDQQLIIKKHIAKKRLTVKILNDEELLELKAKEITSGKLSKQDVSVYAYAKELGAIILTSDRRLRIEAKNKGFEVHGILWVFEAMMEEKLIKPKKAIEKLTELMKINTWLPHYSTILNYFENRSTNASAESFNAKIKAFRASFRGVKNVSFFLFRLANIYA